MIDYDEIGREIDRLEHSDTTYANCERLSVLYTVRDRQTEAPPKEKAVKYSYSAESRSEFIRAFKAAPYDSALKLLDRHMEQIKILYPKEYNMIIKKLNDTE